MVLGAALAEVRVDQQPDGACVGNSLGHKNEQEKTKEDVHDGSHSKSWVPAADIVFCPIPHATKWCYSSRPTLSLRRLGQCTDHGHSETALSAFE